MKIASVAVGNRRLLRLAAFLEKLPPKRFDYATIVGEDWRGAVDLSCGTTACAIGWATTIPSFRKYGLKLRGFDVEGAEGDGRFIHTHSNAGTGLFGITDDEWRYLFIPADHKFAASFEAPWSNATPKQVANHIRRFVAKRAT